MEKILYIAEDIKKTGRTISFLKSECYSISYTNCEDSVLDMLFNDKFKIIIIDLDRLDFDSINLISKIREYSRIPILAIANRFGGIDIVNALRHGIDEIIYEPIALSELVARIKALIRRAYVWSIEEKEKDNIHVIEGKYLTLDNMKNKVYKDKVDLNLSNNEYKILRFFIENPKRVLTKEEIYLKIWNKQSDKVEYIVSLNINRLRKKIEDNPLKPSFIQTIWGEGYKLNYY